MTEEDLRNLKRDWSNYLEIVQRSVDKLNDRIKILEDYFKTGNIFASPSEIVERHMKEMNEHLKELRNISKEDFTSLEEALNKLKKLRDSLP